MLTRKMLYGSIRSATYWRSPMRKNIIIALLALLALLPAFTACNTMQGLGQDIKNGGSDLESAASRNK